MMVGSGAESPIHCQKAFTVVSLDLTGQTSEPQMISWRSELVYQDATNILWVDLPAKGSIKVTRTSI